MVWILRGSMIENSRKKFIERMCMEVLENIGQGIHLQTKMVIFSKWGNVKSTSNV